MSFNYNHVALGGTFDLLHKGHQAIILAAFKMGRKVTLGLTTDKFNGGSKNTFEKQNLRKRNLINYLKRNKLDKRVKIIWLNDIYGPTLKDKTIQALMVTRATKKGADLINLKLREKGFQQLKIIQLPQLKDQESKIISSSRIRLGEIDQRGRNYKKLLLKIAGKRLSEKVRQKLKVPMGKIVNLASHPRGVKLNIISVGDITTRNLLKAGIIPKLSIVDFYVQRKPAFSSLKQLGFTQINPDLELKNTPGQISKTLILEVEKAFKNPQGQVILVDGEEDLAAVPATLLSPLGTKVFYGQPGKGLIKLDVTLQLKEKLCKTLQIR